MNVRRVPTVILALTSAIGCSQHPNIGPTEAWLASRGHQPYPCPKGIPHINYSSCTLPFFETNVGDERLTLKVQVMSVTTTYLQPHYPDCELPDCIHNAVWILYEAKVLEVISGEFAYEVVHFADATSGYHVNANAGPWDLELKLFEDYNSKHAPFPHPYFVTKRELKN